MGTKEIGGVGVDSSAILGGNKPGELVSGSSIVTGWKLAFTVACWLGDWAEVPAAVI